MMFWNSRKLFAQQSRAIYFKPSAKTPKSEKAPVVRNDAWSLWDAWAPSASTTQDFEKYFSPHQGEGFASIYAISQVIL